MHASYMDIRSRINEEPRWYDQNGVPRYEKFSTHLCPNIYAEEIALLEIACQDCHKRFLVEMHWCIFDMIMDRHAEKISNCFIKWLKKDKKGWMPIHYGDPPSHGCVGDTMNCYDLRVVEFWTQNKLQWKRIEKFEIELEKIYKE